MSGSPEGVTAAMTRYDDTPRALVQLHVAAERLIDLRDTAACAALGVDAEQARCDWMAALCRREEPGSWAVADQVRMVAEGLIEASRHAPALWHVVLFRWNEPAGARVEVVNAARPSRE